jgi:hypothetical protein
MKSPELKNLNFKVLFDFPQHFPPHNLPARHRYSPPRKCENFCIDCETKHLCSSRYPYRMSHGADTEDFEQALGKTFPPPPNGKYVDTPVMFLGIEPGGEYGNDEKLMHYKSKKLIKRVPTKHYYWTPPEIGYTRESWKCPMLCARTIFCVCNLSIWISQCLFHQYRQVPSEGG